MKKGKNEKRKQESRKKGRKGGKANSLKCGPAQPSLFVLKRLGPGPKTQSKG